MIFWTWLAQMIQCSDSNSVCNCQYEWPYFSTFTIFLWANYSSNSIIKKSQIYWVQSNFRGKEKVTPKQTEENVFDRSNRNGMWNLFWIPIHMLKYWFLFLLLFLPNAKNTELQFRDYRNVRLLADKSYLHLLDSS